MYLEGSRWSVLWEVALKKTTHFGPFTGPQKLPEISWFVLARKLFQCPNVGRPPCSKVCGFFPPYERQVVNHLAEIRTKDAAKRHPSRVKMRLLLRMASENPPCFWHLAPLVSVQKVGGFTCYFRQVVNNEKTNSEASVQAIK